MEASIRSVTLDYSNIDPSKHPARTGNLITKGVESEVLGATSFSPEDPFSASERIMCYVKRVVQRDGGGGGDVVTTAGRPGDMGGKGAVGGVGGRRNEVYRVNSGVEGVRCEVYGEVGLVRVDEGTEGGVEGNWGKVEGRFEGVETVYGYCNRKDRSRMGGGESKVLLKGGAKERWEAWENGIPYSCKLEGNSLSVGIFPDSRGMRWWCRENGGGKKRMLNLFAHGCGYAKAAKEGGMGKGTNVDIDKGWLELFDGGEGWDNVYGDAGEWVEKFRKRGSQWDIIIVDPPSSSVGKNGKRWSSLTDYPSLVTSLTSLLPSSGGTLVTISNLRSQSPSKFHDSVLKGIKEGGRKGTLNTVVGEGEDGGGMGVKKYIWDVE
ncbi:hypothetical protein TrRE_jg7873 [Triparma retinervis]|uniref:S-adenosylmethionine-dependent methyltransferase domain-containing protein n=1 Tax=Triparma retinervis TaxID=2557542 RepID=A0A9W6ZCS5_9STRA|nr:hypothetical protein TrRE_jg7873 [Triparma retinervis]